MALVTPAQTGDQQNTFLPYGTQHRFSPTNGTKDVRAGARVVGFVKLSKSDNRQPSTPTYSSNFSNMESGQNFNFSISGLLDIIDEKGASYKRLTRLRMSENRHPRQDHYAVHPASFRN